MARRKTAAMPWVQAAADSPYFMTEDGTPWTPIGQNDAITWPDLAGAFRRRDLAGVDRYFAMLHDHGVTCLRLMLEYCHSNHRHFERPAGVFQRNMVTLWDDLFHLAERHQLRFLLTPYDTFWMWLRWDHHPYQRACGGPSADRGGWLTCADTRVAIKRRLAFVIERWGGSGAFFAWDLWNEIHPAHGGNSCSPFGEFIDDISHFVRQTEQRLYGRSHPQTVSIFGPVLIENPAAEGDIYRHPALDFASIHLYEAWTIDCPEDTVTPAISTGRLVRQALAEIHDNRPFLDSEHGPIHLFKDRKVTLPEPFDDEYFRHMQWAHFASGGAGGGMRWPNRHPHSLTPGMRKAQKALADFLPLIDWQRFRRRNLNEEIGLDSLEPGPESGQEPGASLARFGCGDERQAVVWLLRSDQRTPDGRVRTDAPPCRVQVRIPGLEPGCYAITAWDTSRGAVLQQMEIVHATPGDLCAPLAVTGDLALAVRWAGPA